MFEFKQKENSSQPLHKQKSSIYRQSLSHQMQQQKFNNLRNLHFYELLNWRTPIEEFLLVLEQHRNHYSLLHTLFEISQDPLWRNRVAHICAIIRKLHNECSETYGSYLPELTKIENYQSKLEKVMVLADTQVQQHIKLLVCIYLTYNAKYQILEEEGIASCLISTAKTMGSVQKMSEYLWIVAQIRCNVQTVNKLLKLIDFCLKSRPIHQLQKIHLASLTILANYIAAQQSQANLDALFNFDVFQNVVSLGLTSLNGDISQESVLVCNNLMTKSRVLYLKIMNNSTILEQIKYLSGPQKLFFQKIAELKKQSQM